MPSVDNNVAKILRSIPAIDENGLRVLAMIVGVVRQVAPSSSVEPPVALPETEPVAEPSVETVEPQAVAESLPETASLPEASPVVEPSQAVAPSSPTYRLVLNVPEIGLKGFAD